MATKSEKIAARIEAAKAAAAAQIAALEAQAAAAAGEDRERMRKRVMRAADRSGLLDASLSVRDLEAAFRNAIYYKTWIERLPEIGGGAAEASDEQREVNSYEQL